MNIREAQSVLASAGYYNGGLDGDIGPMTMLAVSAVEAEFKITPRRWSNTRRLFAALQAALNHLGFEAGTVDGLIGHNTEEAFNAWLHKSATGKIEAVERKPFDGYTSARAIDLPRERDCPKFYGKAGKGGEAERRLVTVNLPFKLRIDYSLSQSTNKIRVHEKCAAALKNSLIEVYDRYGLVEMRRLGIDRFAGSYNPRTKRGGSTWSMHAYGCAVDFYAAPNGLRMKCPQALFCRPEYKPFLDIMEKHGWLPALRLWGKDAMHFQMARL